MADFACRECGDEARDGSNYCCESCAVEGAYKAGRADGAERERAAVVAYQRRTCCLAQAFAIEAGKHLGVNTDG